jgi:hypothetical protein
MAPASRLLTREKQTRDQLVADGGSVPILLQKSVISGWRLCRTICQEPTFRSVSRRQHLTQPSTSSRHRSRVPPPGQRRAIRGPRNQKPKVAAMIGPSLRSNLR